MDELQALIYSTVSAAVTVPVYDVPPQDAPTPYAQIDELVLSERDTATGNGFTASVTLYVWHESQSRKTVQAIQQQIYNALHKNDMLSTLAYNVIGCQMDTQTTRSEPDGETKTGIQIFTLLLQQK